MKLWRFADPHLSAFAEAGRRGAWTASSDGEVCPECTPSRQERAQPLLLAWMPGSDRVGDFTWPGFDSEVVLTTAVAAKLVGMGGFEAGAVEFVEDEDGIERRGKRVGLPYQGPELCEMWVTAWANLNPGRSSVELERRCGTCGRERWEVFGVERWTSTYDRESKSLRREQSERLPGAGVIVEEADLAGAGVFRLHELPGWIFCTDEVRSVIEAAAFTNVSFLEMGDTVSSA